MRVVARWRAAAAAAAAAAATWDVGVRGTKEEKGKEAEGEWGGEVGGWNAWRVTEPWEGGYTHNGSRPCLACALFPSRYASLPGEGEQAQKGEARDRRALTFCLWRGVWTVRHKQRLDSKTAICFAYLSQPTKIPCGSGRSRRPPLATSSTTQRCSPPLAFRETYYKRRLGRLCNDARAAPPPLPSRNGGDVPRRFSPFHQLEGYLDVLCRPYGRGRPPRAARPGASRARRPVAVAAGALV